MRWRDPRRDPALFSQTLGLLAAAAGCFALGAYAGPHVTTGIAILAYLGVFGCLLSLPAAARRSAALATALLLAFGAGAGLAIVRTLAYYAAADPRVMWQAGGMAGMLTAACGIAGYLARSGLAPLARLLLLEALAIALCGIVLVSEYMVPPSIGWAAVAAAAYFSLAALGVWLVLRTRDCTSAPLLAASVVAAPANALFFVLRNSCSLAFGAVSRRRAGVAAGPTGPR